LAGWGWEWGKKSLYFWTKREVLEKVLAVD
jgi:hypothetical protein